MAGAARRRQTLAWQRFNEPASARAGLVSAWSNWEWPEDERDGRERWRLQCKQVPRKPCHGLRLGCGPLDGWKQETRRCINGEVERGKYLSAVVMLSQVRDTKLHLFTRRTTVNMQQGAGWGGLALALNHAWQ